MTPTKGLREVSKSGCVIAFCLVLIGWTSRVAASSPASHDGGGKKTISLAPHETVHPFDEHVFDDLTTWLKGSGHKDSQEVFSIADGMVRLSGEGYGYIATRDEYKDYRLSLEYRWGQKSDGSGAVRNSGILLHAHGPDGNANGTWMASVECQLAQGCEGDLIAIQGTDSTGRAIPVTFASNTLTAEDGNTRWNPEGRKTVYSGKQFWWSQHEVGFLERLDTRGKNDIASPTGEWTRVECICQADRITIKINGVTVNECYDVAPQYGKILLENEGNEVFFRNVKLTGLKPLKR
jgi:hypothetical protein